MLSQRPTDDINYSVVEPDKRLNISFTKSKTKFCFSLIAIVLIATFLSMEHRFVNLKHWIIP